MKLIKLLIKLLLVILIIVGAAVGITLYQLSDSSFSEPDYLKDIEPIKYNANNFISRSFENTKENGEIELTFEEKELNIILKSICLDLDEQIKDSNIVIETMYVDVLENNDIKFISYLDVMGFKTSLKGDFHMELINMDFTIQINNIQVGKMNFEREKVVALIKMINGDNLKNDLSLDGINISSDLSKMTVTISIDSLKDKIVSLMKETDEYGLYSTLLGIIFRIDDLIHLAKDVHEIGMNINLNQFAYSEEKDVPMPYFVNFDDVNIKVETLLNNNIANEENVNDIATFIARGNNASNEVIDATKDIDLSSVGINNNSTYKGIINYDDRSFSDTLISQIPTSIEELNNFNGFKLRESEWNNFFAKSDAIGQIFNFIREEDGLFKSSYIGVNSLYIDIIDNHFALYLTISINGKNLVINFELDNEKTDGLKINSIVSSMRLGEIELLDNEIKSLLTFLNGTLKADWIQIKAEEKKINFDFTTIFSENKNLSDFLNSSSNVHTSFKEDEGNGYTLIEIY